MEIWSGNVDKPFSVDEDITFNDHEDERERTKEVFKQGLGAFLNRIEEAENEKS